MRFILLLLLVLPINGFAKLPFIKKQNEKYPIRELVIEKMYNMEDFQHFKQGSLIELPKKIDGFIELSRLKKNIFPTTILVFLSGLVTSPTNWRTWVFSKPFISAFLMVLLLNSASMVINDIHDIKIDRINNPKRPLPSGLIELNEARAFFLGLVSIYTLIGLKYLPFLKHIWIGSLLGIILYTPIFKKIILIKNLVCASIVTLTVPFVGFSVLSTLPTGSLIGGLEWMHFTMRILFIHSFYIEVLLDILDKEGDESYNIKTMPVVFGKTNTLYFLSFALLGNFYNTLFNIMTHYGNTKNIQEIYKSIMMIVALSVTYQPLIINTSGILEYKFSKDSIKNAVYSTTISIIIYLLIYLSSLFIHSILS